MTEYVDYQLADGVATLTMDDGKANALGMEMLARLTEGLDQAAEEAEVAVIIGRPGLLCGGFDLKLINGPAEGRQAMVEAGAELMMKLYLHPQPLIIGCTGHAVAAGAFMLCTADFRIGISGDYKIGLNETAIGLTLPSWGLELARDRLDPRKVSMATMGAELYAPEQAVDVGFLDQAVGQDEFHATLAAKAAALKELDKAAYAGVKQGLRGPRVAVIRDGL